MYVVYCSAWSTNIVFVLDVGVGVNGGFLVGGFEQGSAVIVGER
jgi:hypothetical protein